MENDSTLTTKIHGDYQVIHAKSSQGYYFFAEDGTEASRTDSDFPNYWFLLKM